MRVLIETDVETYPNTIMHFGEEIVFPVVPRDQESTAGIEVPHEIAARWLGAREAWRQAQAEAEKFITG